jgi:cytoskeleton protein RodZ
MNDEKLQPENNADAGIHQQQFGECFREAREKAKLSAGDVAEALKLHQDIIHALESSRVDLLPVAAFTQGYIRSYARYLKLPEKEIIAVYNQLLPQKEIPLSARSSLPRQAHSGETGFKLISYALVLAGLLAMAVWWFQSTSEIEDLSSTAVNNEPVSIEKTWRKAADVYSDGDGNSQDPALTIKKNTSPNTQLKTADKDRQSVNISEFIAASGDDVLMISTTSESWLEISDVNVSRLVFELIKKDSYYRIQGQAPFKIFLGNAPSVSVKINDQAVNILQYLKNDNLVHVYIYKKAKVVNAIRNESRRDENSSRNTDTQNSVSDNIQLPDETLSELE